MFGDGVSELVVLSHLRWDSVWQRPHHLISRLGATVSTWFVEEPLAAGRDAEPQLRVDERPDLTRVWLDVASDRPWVGFDDDEAQSYGDRLARLFPATDGGRIVWLYTAMALPLVERIPHSLLVYDVMDDLTAFAGAARAHRLRHHAALRRADIVFTGGRSLHKGVTSQRTHGVHCHPSGVEPDHFVRARNLRPRDRARPVAGYVGVVDERLDLELIEQTATALPDWDLQMVGPVAKIDPTDLPTAPNLHWLGRREYEELPQVLAGFDVALMPFAHNEATRSISPTKTLEYFAAGLPVVSTRVPDVVEDYGDLVFLADDAPRFADACHRALADPPGRSIDDLLRRRHWDAIAADMADACHACLRRGAVPIDGSSQRPA